jgi:hypothetical protein
VSIREPSPEVLDDADLDALEELAKHAQDLSAKGPIPPAVWRALWAEALKAAGGHEELLDTLAMFKPEGA